MKFLNSPGGYKQWREPVRTLLAQDMIVQPALNRLTIKLGFGVVGSYVLDAFFQRLAGGETLQWPFSTVSHGDTPEQILRPDGIFNVDSSGWKKPSRIDADEILLGFDVDDRGFGYFAASIYGWGLARLWGAGAKGFQFPFDPNTGSPVQVGTIVALRNAAGKYLALTSTARGGVLFDVTSGTSAVKIPTAQISAFKPWAKTDDARIVAIINQFASLTIIAADNLTGGASLFTASGYTSVTSDGVNFFALKAGAIDKIAPAGDRYAAVTAGALDPALPNATHIHYGAGHIVVIGGDGLSGPWLRVYRVENLALTPVPTTTLDLSGMLLVDALVANDGAKLQLIVGGKTTGEVVTLEGSAVPPTPLQPPTIAVIVPASGPASGGQTVTITGTNLKGATVSFSDTLTASVVTTTDTTVSLVTPAGVAGASNVRVTTPGGTAVVWSGYTYTADAPPPVTTAGRVVDVQAREFDSATEALAWTDSIKSTATTLPPFKTSKGTFVVAWF